MMVAEVKDIYKYATLFEIPYIQHIIFSLNTIGSWPYEVMGEKKWFSDLQSSKWLFTLNLCCLLASISFIKKNYDNLSLLDLGRNVVNVLLMVMCLQKLSMPWTKMYKDMTKSFFQKMHLFHHRDKNDFAKKMYNKVEKISSLLCKVLHFELYIGIVMYNLTTLFNSYQRGMFNTVKPLNATYDLAIFYDLPFDYSTKLTGFIAVFIYNCFITFNSASVACVLDLYLFIIMFHLWGHIKILNNHLLNFPKPEMKKQNYSKHIPPWYNEEESRKITSLLIESIDHHKIIKEFTNEVSMAYGTTIFVYFIFHQLCGCFMLVEISQMSTEAFGYFGILTFTAFQQLIEMSIIFELFAHQSETIKDAVYAVPWECMGTKNRKLVLLYLCDVQNHMHVKALGMVPVGVQTMASILKTSLSYFMLLRTSTSTHS